MTVLEVPGTSTSFAPPPSRSPKHAASPNPGWSVDGAGVPMIVSELFAALARGNLPEAVGRLEVTIGTWGGESAWLSCALARQHLLGLVDAAGPEADTLVVLGAVSVLAARVVRVKAQRGDGEDDADD